MAVSVFLDTSVLLAGLVDFGPQSAPAQSLLHAVAEKQVTTAGTAWHCCLEVYSVSTRLPPEFRLTSADALQLIEDEIRNGARMLIYGCRRGRRRIDPSSESAGSLRKDWEYMCDEHRRLWLARNRPGGLEDSVNRLAAATPSAE